MSDSYGPKGSIKDVEEAIGRGANLSIEVHASSSYMAGNWDGHGYVAVLEIFNPERATRVIRDISGVQRVVYCTSKLYLGDMISSEGAAALKEIKAILEAQQGWYGTKKRQWREDNRADDGEGDFLPESQGLKQIGG